MKGQWITYSEEELAWIEARKERPRRLLYSDFLLVFERHDVTFANFKALCTRKGWKTGRTGCFSKGRAPHNKGKRFSPAGSEKGRFKKGHVPHTFRGVGHERVCSKDGYVIMIVDEPNPWTGANTRPVHKHRYLWEKAHGPVPEGHRLKCLDGDKTNTDPSNWKPIPMALAPRLNGRFGRGYDTAPEELKPTIMATVELEHLARTITKGRSE